MDTVRRSGAGDPFSRIGIDVVDLHRIDRIVRDFGGSAADVLLDAHEVESSADLGHAELVRVVGAALGTKEAWVKARLRRPAGWRFPDACFVPRPDQERSPSEPAFRAVLDRFRADLAIDSVMDGVVRDGGAAVDPAGDTAAESPGHAWYGVLDRWLVSAVIL
ncbi:hypothetical protein GA0115240_13477 [Streptomyces sp. DvalAA-14]|uniref:4'-phosphopantetheinyl transferase superfamily protein n=1 Tax=unclassified Streptomyces TaxID=2593676 RepID=UPI00081B009F|nr:MULTISPECIES: 4'-phosphopantetheinyl transferase superfamily protein [unclassified Streptomyces]MYS21707.1 hypothetical protein [Streptomyces sp. SID4948]SCD99370.1 hypothetical protein GA0115240_13477 [Streptomyces sp. DvalAA-14]